jgi:hypothetical protein
LNHGQNGFPRPLAEVRAGNRPAGSDRVDPAKTWDRLATPLGPANREHAKPPTRGRARAQGLLGDPAPFVGFIPGYEESSMNFTLICRVSTFVDRYLLQQELCKRILSRFRRQGMEIPYPRRRCPPLRAQPTSRPRRSGIGAQIPRAGWKASWVFSRAAYLGVERKQTTPGR